MTPQAESIWAKTDMASPESSRWLPLYRHLADTQAVAGIIWDNWCSKNIKDNLAAELGDSETAKNTYTFLAGIHDTGKASPAFACQILNSVHYSRLTDKMDELGLHINPKLIGDASRGDFRHELVGYAALKEWLTFNGADEVTADSYAFVLALHHGNGPSRQDVNRTKAKNPRYFGDDSWADCRNEFIDWMFALNGMTIPDRPLSRRAQILLSGLVIMADWIASDQTNFPLVGRRNVSSIERAELAWKELDIPSPWRPSPTEDFLKEFPHRFNGMTPRPFQQEAIRVAESMDSPSIICMEAPMGEGKTEAALACAEVLCANLGAGGIYYALPTQATANAMFDRIVNWVDGLPSAHGTRSASTFLSHGGNRFHEGFSMLPWHAANSDEDTLQAVANQWLRGNKRGNLSNFVVGTIDQVLAMTLKAKHLTLRHLAMAGKVVILDEVHACDAYMSEYLERSLEWLGMLSVPVILLSATLTEDKRQELVNAYEKGAGRHETVLATTPVTPIITCGDGTVSLPAGSGRELMVSVQPIGSNDMVQMVQGIVKDGGRVAIVRNTVARACETASKLEHAGIPVILDHARFTAQDRAEHDEQVLEALGGDSRTPCVVVGTQVIEQSLDIDSDIMISDIAPMDLLLQRAGRLHRHDRERPSGFADARLLIDGIGTDPKQLFPKSFISIYSAWPLLRSYNLLRLGNGQTGCDIRFPSDIPVLTDAAYQESDDPMKVHALLDWVTRMGEKADKAHGVYMLPEPWSDSPKRPRLEGWLKVPKGTKEQPLTDDARGVRDGLDSIDVILLENRNGVLYPMGCEEEIPFDPNDISIDEWKTVMARTIKVNQFMLRPGVSLKDFCDGIDRAAPSEWRILADSGPLAGCSALVFKNHKATVKTRTAITTVSYDSVKGWQLA